MKQKSSENVKNELIGKESTFWSRYCCYLVASVAVVAVAFSGTELYALDRFGETFTSKLCEILPTPPNKVSQVSIDYYKSYSLQKCRKNPSVLCH